MKLKINIFLQYLNENTSIDSKYRKLRKTKCSDNSPVAHLNGFPMFQNFENTWHAIFWILATNESNVDESEISMIYYQNH